MKLQNVSQNIVCKSKVRGQPSKSPDHKNAHGGNNGCYNRVHPYVKLRDSSNIDRICLTPRSRLGLSFSLPTQGRRNVGILVGGRAFCGGQIVCPAPLVKTGLISIGWEQGLVPMSSYLPVALLLTTQGEGTFSGFFSDGLVHRRRKYGGSSPNSLRTIS